MAMPQRDELIDEIRKTDLLLEYAMMHGEEAERLRTRSAVVFAQDAARPGGVIDAERTGVVSYFHAFS